MEQQPISTARVAIKWGLITGVASIIFSTILFVSGQAANSALSWLGILISVATMVYAMKEFRTENGGFMSYGQGLGVGTMMSAVGGFISTTYGYIYRTFIDPTLMQQMMDKVRSDLEEKGMSEDQIASTMAITEKFSSPGLGFVSGIIGAIVIGFIIALIVSAILKKDKQIF
jgi:Protein of unknown function (DUF4199)